MAKTTHPLRTGWQTTEGVLSVAGVALLSVGDALHKLPGWAGATGTALIIASYVASRTGIKMKAAESNPTVAGVLDSKDPMNAILKDLEHSAGTDQPAPVAAPTVTTPVVAS